MFYSFTIHPFLFIAPLRHQGSGTRWTPPGVGARNGPPGWRARWTQPRKRTITAGGHWLNSPWRLATRWGGNQPLDWSCEIGILGDPGKLGRAENDDGGGGGGKRWEGLPLGLGEDVRSVACDRKLIEQKTYLSTLRRLWDRESPDRILANRCKYILAYKSSVPGRPKLQGITPCVLFLGLHPVIFLFCNLAPRRISSRPVVFPCALTCRIFSRVLSFFLAHCRVFSHALSFFPFHLLQHLPRLSEMAQFHFFPENRSHFVCSFSFVHDAGFGVVLSKKAQPFLLCAFFLGTWVSHVREAVMYVSQSHNALSFPWPI